MPASATPARNSQPLTSYVVIPARLASTRLPAKLLLCETGKPLIQHTYEAACRAHRPRGVCVAADSEAIAAVVRGFGGRVELTSVDCPSGTDRVAEVAARLPEIDIIVNVQGDEPELSGEAIDWVVALLEHDPTACMATLATPIRRRQLLDDPACVKVALAPSGGPSNSAAAQPAYRALYFSRSSIPYARQWHDDLLQADPPHFFQHIGLYAYRREFLLQLAGLPRSRLEAMESLEQLRVLENGHPIVVGLIDEAAVGIDTPEDYRAFVERFKRRQARGAAA
jgi:3-deoxy-manno-octulosonate cytidylyltransferase (CMP-KDO synthetase)